MTALVLLSDGFEEIEALTPVDYLRRSGVKVITLAVNEKALWTKEGYLVKGAHWINVLADGLLSDYIKNNEQTADCIVIPGGMPGAANIAQSEEALRLIEKMFTEQKLVASICASPAIVLSKTGILKDKKWTCYPGMKDNAKEYISNHIDNVPFVTDKNLITGRGPGAAEEFSMEIVKLLCGEETAQKIKTSACQR